MALRPEAAAFLAGPGRALRFPDPPPALGSPAAAELLARARAPRPARPPGERRPLWRVEDRAIDGPGGPLPLRIYRPGPGAAPAAGARPTGTDDGRAAGGDRGGAAGEASAAALPLLVYLHGGGWVMGDLEMHDATCRALASFVDCVVVSVDYRLAPEHPHPAALDDTLAAIGWARREAPALGADPARIAIGGSSAGGNLAAAAALRSRGEAPRPLAAQLLLYPVLDSRLATASVAEFGTGHLLDRAQMEFYWDAYAPAPVDRASPAVSPAHASRLAGLPSTIVVTAEHDPLRDEGEQYAARLRADGVRVDLRRARGQIHGFLALFQDDPEVERLLARVAASLKRLLG